MPIRSALSRLSGLIAPVTRGMTLGVRGACLDAEGRVFMVRHSYMPGWYLPGGGVERGESAAEALERELEEEGGIVLGAPATLFAVYWNRKRARDHVVLFVARDFARPRPPAYPNHEIAEVGFFDPLSPPTETSPATRRRLTEILNGTPPDPHW
ncbi:NUDIX domain-containing protein [Kaistia algarum]|uniref:NUDIX domain-containing protein n=1 Tax=Kaistia algarum TaxID=2083279 RepID=UPI0022544E38|nr:NUDIX domain-containing protein [Kaistia algarum]MCX5515605.1 NUDIX domain-containing protein [Kaistia algarum]